MADEFKLGDLVQLKSGGPMMTVDYIGPHMAGGSRDEALCSWFEETKGKRERKKDWFELVTLRKVNPNERGPGFAVV